jgi:hypothetical protein
LEVCFNGVWYVWCLEFEELGGGMLTIVVMMVLEVNFATLFQFVDPLVDCFSWLIVMGSNQAFN